VAIFPPIEGRRPPVLARYLLASIITVVILLRTAPRALIVTNPPVLLGLIALAWSRLCHIPLALDSHPGSFGGQEDTTSARLLPVHRFLARRVTVSLVTSEYWVAVVRGWEGEALVLHEAPGPWVPSSPDETGKSRPLVVFVTRFSPDEPVAAGLTAAALLPAVDFAVTGPLGDLSPELKAVAPPNVQFVGFLPAPSYRALVARADIVLCLTTEPTSVMRSAYEAVYAGKVLVVSDWPLDRELFPDALLVANEPHSIARGVEEALARQAELSEQAAAARRRQVARVEAQLGELRRVLGVRADGGADAGTVPGPVQ
jgi:glycosyltransferase involved in cell wall biosynthesis